MITIKTENYNHISQDFYNKIIDSLDLTLISCTCGHSGSLIRHGSYKRKIPLKDRIITLTVVRVYCKHCGHTHALLLSSFVPYSQIPLTVHISSILACEQNSSIRPVLAGQCCVDENNIRFIFRSYRLHWQERLRSAGLTLFKLALLVTGCFPVSVGSLCRLKPPATNFFFYQHNLTRQILPGPLSFRKRRKN